MGSISPAGKAPRLLRDRGGAGIVALSAVIIASGALTSCGRFEMGDPGEPGPLAVYSSENSIIAVLPECAPEPEEGQIRRADDAKVWVATKARHIENGTVPLTTQFWRQRNGNLPSSPNEYRGMEVVLVDSSYRAWLVDIPVDADFSSLGPGEVLTKQGIDTIDSFRTSASCD